jgi:hypothetical protein
LKGNARATSTFNNCSNLRWTRSAAASLASWRVTAAATRSWPTTSIVPTFTFRNSSVSLRAWMSAEIRTVTSPSAVARDSSS